MPSPVANRRVPVREWSSTLPLSAFGVCFSMTEDAAIEALRQAGLAAEPVKLHATIIIIGGDSKSVVDINGKPVSLFYKPFMVCRENGKLNVHNAGPGQRSTKWESPDLESVVISIVEVRCL